MKNQSLNFKEFFMEHFELTRLMFVTGFIRMRRNLDTRIPREKIRHSKLRWPARGKIPRNMAKRTEHV
jgi:hypothetical protein